MPKKRHTPEEIIQHLRTVEIEQSKGTDRKSTRLKSSSPKEQALRKPPGKSASRRKRLPDGRPSTADFASIKPSG